VFVDADVGTGFIRAVYLKFMMLFSQAKLLAKLPPVHHESFLAKWREMEEILGEVEIRKFLEYVKQLEEFMGTMPQLQDAYQYFSLKIASVDKCEPYPVPTHLLPDLP
jgi:hypothetical protein